MITAVALYAVMLCPGGGTCIPLTPVLPSIEKCEQVKAELQKANPGSSDQMECAFRVPTWVIK